MSRSYSFHPEALAEYSAAAEYYLRMVSAEVAEAFVATIEGSVADIITSPTRWRVVESEVRRYVCQRFPFVIYYRWEAEGEHVQIYAVMHCSRRPGLWRGRAQ